jgi:CRP/FNR family transcriptional regulator
MTTLDAAELPELTEPELRAELAQSALRRKANRGQILLDLGQDVAYLPLVLKGQVRVKMFDPDGHELLLYTLGTDETCLMTLQAVLHTHRSLVKAQADNAAEVLLVPVAKVKQWQFKYKSWAQYICNLYGLRFNQMVDTVRALAFSNLAERLWRTLQTRAIDNVVTATHQHLADELGTAREVVSRLLKSWEGQGKVALGRGRITLLQ